jgi:hypothetical protein
LDAARHWKDYAGAPSILRRLQPLPEPDRERLGGGR